MRRLNLERCNMRLSLSIDEAARELNVRIISRDGQGSGESWY